MKTKPRCEWSDGHPLYVSYHDSEWGVPEHDETRLFAKLLLDGAQAGLSWLTILKKRDAYYRAFDGFDPEKIARYNEAKINQLMADKGIVRNRLKVRSAVSNAQAFLHIKEQGLSFHDLLWQVVDGETIQNHFRELSDLPSQTGESLQLSRILKGHGFRFVGPTICYAFMQAVGMVNDHLTYCFRHAALIANVGSL